MGRTPKTPRIPKLPDLLYPRSSDKRDESDENPLKITMRVKKPKIDVPPFVQDLQVGDILQRATELSIPNWSREYSSSDRSWVTDKREEYTGSLVAKIIEEIFTVPPDLNTADYRLDVFDYLLGNQKGFENFQRIFENLNSLIVQGFQREGISDIWMRVAEDYALIFDITENYVPFGSDAPLALQEMDRYFEELKRSNSHRKMGELADKLNEPYDINLRIRIDPTEGEVWDYNDPRVISASVVRASEFDGEFGNKFMLDDRYWTNSSFENNKPVKKILERAIQLKYERHLTDTAAYITSTLSLFEPMLIYMGYIQFMRQQQSRGIEFCRPEFSDIGEITNAKNPLVTVEPIIGNDIYYDSQNRVRIVTGPNNGGKTVYVKTVGLVHALSQRGFPVPASSAKLNFMDGIFTHVVNPDDISNAEGRYKNEMRRMNEIFDRVTPNSLVMLDEPCGGTTLESGVKVSCDFLRALGKLGAVTYLTTHMSGVAEAVTSGFIPNSENLHMHMEEDGTPTYRLEHGLSPMYYGEFIPKQMGLNYEHLTKRLTQRASKEGFSF